MMKYTRSVRKSQGLRIGGLPLSSWMIPPRKKQFPSVLIMDSWEVEL